MILISVNIALIGSDEWASLIRGGDGLIHPDRSFIL